MTSRIGFQYVRKWTPYTASSLSFSSDLVRAVHVRGRGIAARRAKRGRQPEKKKRGCPQSRLAANEICVGLTTQKYDWRMSEALTTTCQQSKMLAEDLQECLSENRSIRRSYLRDRNLNTQSLSRLAPSVTRVVICVSRGFCTTD